ncbi:MAG: DUF4242 domain-containing protein [Dehalococcoidia bacterium]|nr:DUF4242 domain-containing protein [Dehalococcoidia bacterium]
MALYSIRRPFPGAAATDVDAAGFRALACVPFYPGMRWIRTFWDGEREETLCIYEAGSADDVWRHSEQAGLPCAEVREVEEKLPEELVAMANGAQAAS